MGYHEFTLIESQSIFMLISFKLDGKVKSPISAFRSGTIFIPKHTYGSYLILFSPCWFDRSQMVGAQFTAFEDDGHGTPYLQKMIRIVTSQ